MNKTYLVLTTEDNSLTYYIEGGESEENSKKVLAIIEENPEHQWLRPFVSQCDPSQDKTSGYKTIIDSYGLGAVTVQDKKGLSPEMKAVEDRIDEWKKSDKKLVGKKNWFQKIVSWFADL